jgi:hypothetical protein
VSDSRLPRSIPPPAAARFRCLVCARFVQAGPSGVCPRCGFAPPMPLPVKAERPAPARPGAIYWSAAIAFSLLAGLLAALAALR